MGYISEVTLTITNADFITLVNKARTESEAGLGLLQTATVYRTEKFTTLHFDWIKWYESYDDISFIEGFINDIPYVFKRVGEDCPDIEIRENDVADYDMCHCVSVVTCLDVEDAGVLTTLDDVGSRRISD